MSDVTRILSQIESGDPQAAEQLLPLVYDELKKLAKQRMAREKPGQTLVATALVHEAYLRLLASPGHGSTDAAQFNSQGHFFAAAAEAMRRIVVENARRKRQAKRGGDRRQVPLAEAVIAVEAPSEDVLALDESLGRLEADDALAAQVVKLRYFAGLKMPEVAEALGISLRTAERNWTFARTWLHRDLESDA